KIDDDTVAAQVAKLGQKGDAASVGGASASDPSDSSTRDIMPAKDEITFDDFTKLDLRVGTVLECEKVPKADKLLKLTVDTGLDTRTVVSGIAEHFAPEDVVGRQVTLLINLAPRALRGIESQGMVLMASTDDGGLRFVTPEEGVAPGNVIS
ncbi:MAG: methionine--tRNA ligase subunit beta, partial [Bacteroidetes bacterium]|nr:methionine--tRNA ligase subunit beta [Bacteroidota bacterium]